MSVTEVTNCLRFALKTNKPEPLEQDSGTIGDFERDLAVSQKKETYRIVEYGSGGRPIEMGRLFFFSNYGMVTSLIRSIGTDVREFDVG